MIKKNTIRQVTCKVIAAILSLAACFGIISIAHADGPTIAAVSIGSAELSDYDRFVSEKAVHMPLGKYVYDEQGNYFLYRLKVLRNQDDSNPAGIPVLYYWSSENVAIPDELNGFKIRDFRIEVGPYRYETTENGSYEYTVPKIRKLSLGENFVGCDTPDSFADQNSYTDYVEELEVSASNPYVKTVDNVLYSKDGKQLLYVPRGIRGEKFLIPEGVEEVSCRAFDIFEQDLSRMNIPNAGNGMVNTTVALNAVEFLPASGGSEPQFAFISVPNSVIRFYYPDGFYINNAKIDYNGDFTLLCRTGYLWNNIEVYLESEWEPHSRFNYEIRKTDDNKNVLFVKNFSLDMVKNSTLSIPDKIEGKNIDIVCLNIEESGINTVKLGDNVKEIFWYENIKSIDDDIYTYEYRNDYSEKKSITKVAAGRMFDGNSIRCYGSCNELEVLFDISISLNTSLKVLKVPDDNRYIRVKDGAVYSRDYKTLKFILPAVKPVVFKVDSRTERIKTGAFLGAEHSLKKVTVPKGLREIGESAFEETGIRQLIFAGKGKSKLQKIGDCAFMFCDSLKKIKLPDSLTSIGQYAFCGCRSISKIRFPKSLRKISIEAFEGCEGLKKVNVRCNGNIGSRAFSLCFNLKTVVFSKDVKQIGNNCLAYCNKLKKIKVMGKKTWLRKNATLGFEKNRRADKGKETTTIVELECYKNSAFHKYYKNNKVLKKHTKMLVLKEG